MKTKSEKHLDAVARNATWNHLTTQQKIFALQQRPGNCKKQLSKLEGK